MTYRFEEMFFLLSRDGAAEMAGTITRLDRVL